MAADMAKVVVKPRVRVDAMVSKPRGEGGETTCGRHSVEGDCLKARSGVSETSPHPSLVGARVGGTPRADHRESDGS